MTQVTVARDIAAPAALVFRAVSDVAHLPETNPDILSVEFLGETREGVGTRFCETRKMGKREAVTELEITEYDSPSRVRFVTDSHGTIWDTVFTVTSKGADHCALEIRMDARPHRLLPKIMNPLFKGLFRKGIAGHLDTVARWCEQQA